MVAIFCIKKGVLTGEGVCQLRGLTHSKELSILAKQPISLLAKDCFCFFTA